MAIDANALVLIVDDFALGRHILRLSLIKHGFNNFLEAENGAEGLKIIHAQHKSGQPVKLVLSDLNMPIMGGLQLLKELRSNAEFKNLPFIIATTDTDSDRLNEVFKFDAVAVLIKPLNSPGTDQKLAAVLKKFDFGPA